MNGHPLFFAEASYSCAVAEPISSDDCESVKMYVMSGADAIASFRAWSRYNIDYYLGGKTKRRAASRVTYHLLPHGIVFRHPSFVLLGHRIDETMIVDDFR